MAWLRYTGRFSPLPRLLANVGVLFVLLVMAATFRDNAKLLLVGEFLCLLQVVKFYEPPTNRDFAQLVVLSLLLMVAASISTASLLFGMLMIAYLFCALYCCLLFHLKVETDHAKRALAVPPEQVNPSTLKHDQRYLASSMRRLTLLVAVISIATAIITFMFFPRGPGEGVLAPLRWKPSETLTGFSDSVNFQNVAKITQNTQPIAWVKLLDANGKPAKPQMPLLLRGVTLNVYSGDGSKSNGVAYQWTRNPGDADSFDSRSDERHVLEPPDTADEITQQIQLEPTGTNALFSIGAPNELTTFDSMHLRHLLADETLESAEQILQSIRYTVTSNPRLRYKVPDFGVLQDDRRSGTSQIDPKIEAFARKAGSMRQRCVWLAGGAAKCRQVRRSTRYSYRAEYRNLSPPKLFLHARSHRCASH